MKNLPEYFTNVTRAKSGKSVTMTTLSLVSESDAVWLNSAVLIADKS